MTQVAYGQKGYLGSSMSVRAVEAYEQGEMPISRWTKTAIIQAVKDYCFDFDLAYNPDIEKKTKAELAKEFLEYKSWHHSSRTAREVEFFGLNEDAVCRSFEQMNGLRWRRDSNSCSRGKRNSSKNLNATLQASWHTRRSIRRCASASFRDARRLR